MADPTLLINSHDDGYEEDPELTNTLRFDWAATPKPIHPQGTPMFILNGPEGQVTLIGRDECEAYAVAILRKLYPKVTIYPGGLGTYKTI